MTKFKFILLLFIIFASTLSAEAVDIQYGSLKSYKNNDVLIEYYGVGVKNNYICSILNFKCTSTKKTILGKPNTVIFKASLKKELKEKRADYATLSKSGNWLAYYLKSDDVNKTRTYIIKNVKTNTNYTNTSSVNYWDLVDDQGKVFEFSPDEKSLTYIDDKDGTMSIYKVDLKSLKDGSFKSTKIQTLAYTIGYFMYFDSQNIYYVGNTKENPYKWSLYNLDLKTGKSKLIETYVSYLDKITKIGSSLIYIRLQEKGYGPEVYNTKTKKIGNFKVPKINTKIDIKNEEYVKVGNQPAVVMTPIGYNPKKTYPLLVWLHGGPLRQTSLGYHPYHSYGIYDSTLRLLQKNDVIILKLDYRGSLGVGQAYSESINGSVGKGDIDDVMEAVKYAKYQYHISDTYLAGNSYGGYMSLRAVVEYPETFKGIFSINGVTDWESLLVKMETSIFNTPFGGLPNTNNRSLYNQASIIDKINNLGNQRIEIIQGEADNTIPLWQSILLNDKLKAANKNVNLVTYPGEDHVFKEKKNVNDLCVRIFGLIGIPADKDCTN